MAQNSTGYMSVNFINISCPVVMQISIQVVANVLFVLPVNGI